MTTNLAGAGIEVARRACGGHGYSELSGLPEFLTDYVAGACVATDGGGPTGAQQCTGPCLLCPT